MALRWVSTGVDEFGNETGYNIDDGTGDVWDSSGSQLDPATAEPIFDYSQFYNDYQDQAPVYDPSTSPTDVDVTQYIKDNPDLSGQDSSTMTAISGYLSKFGQAALDKLKSVYTKKDSSGNDVADWKSIAATAGGLYGLYQNQQRQNQPKTGYQGSVPKYEAVRSTVANTYDPNRRAGSGGQSYFTGAVRYASPDKVATAQSDAAAEAKALETRNKENPARESKKMAAGGIAALAKGRYLGGATDGMADKIPAKIDGKQEARLSHGEFVVSADVVSALGGGNSESGAQRLYDMMDRVRTAAHGKKQQMKPVNPKKVLPV